MKTLRLLLTSVLLCLSIASWAQDSLKVTFQERNKAAITSQRLKRRDRNGNFCALVQFSAANIRNYDFVSSVRIDTVEYDEALNLANVFIVPDYNNTTITIVNQEFPAYRLETGALSSLHIYDAKISVVRDHGDKTRTLLMPVISVGGIMNYGIMVAFAKTIGPYFKFKYNFEATSASTSVDDNYKIDGGGTVFTSGKSKNARLSITGGVLFRLFQDNIKNTTHAFYGYAGGGYGKADLLWEDIDQNWYTNKDHSHGSFEIEAGIIYRSNAFAIMAGVQTNEFSYMEANIGVGVMF